EFINSGVRGSAVSCGSNFPDALCAGPILYKLGYPLILSDKGKSESGALYHNGKTIDHLLVFGGKTVLPDGNIEHLFTKNVPLNIATAPAKTHVLEAQIDRNNLDQYFQAYRINVGDAVYNRINGKSYVSNPHISLSSLRYLKVHHYNYEGEIQVGEIIVNSAIADRTLSIFKSFFLARYQICQMRLIDDFWVPGRDGNVADDNSIDHNNTSSFNYRVVAGQTQLSRHALGLAIDINPLENPYVTYDGAGNPHVPHDITAEFVSYDKNGDPTFKSNPSINYIHWRSSSVPHVIMNNDYCDQVFKMSGFAWGGDWIVPKDFQHYEIPK
ncbi:MAG: M15 family metallopeptidase, partial [Lachnospiraceae bacterium]|nr:M15 family metallopeptidase [Candidatus Equihabitans merdae]